MAERNYFITLLGFYNPEVATWGQQYAGVNTSINGTIGCEGQVLQSCEGSKWYHIKIKYRSHSDLCDVWVDGVLKGINIACEKTGDYNSFQIATRFEGSYTRAWFDDIKVYADSLTMMLHYFFNGIYLDLNGETDSAKILIRKALTYPEVNKGLNAESYLPVSMLHCIYDSEGDFDSIAIYKQKALNWYHQHGYLFLATYMSNDLGLFYFRKNKLNVAEKYYQQSETIAMEMISKNLWYRHDSLLNIISLGTDLIYPLHPWHLKELIWILGKSTYNGLYKINAAKQRSSEALHYYIAFSNARDTLYHLQRNREEYELKIKGDVMEKLRNQEDIFDFREQIYFRDYKLKQSVYFLVGLGIIVILVVLLAFVFIRQNKLRNEQQNLLLQQKLFRSQMNPHFIFNSLTSIQNFILEEDSDRASKYLSRFSKLIRNILESSVEEYVRLQEEISTIENYLELQKIRFQNKFDYTIDVDKAIHPENMLIPPMLAQPFIENSIEHGIKHKKSKGNIYIRFVLKNSSIFFEVEDDGIGREKAKEILYQQNKEHKSLATAITMERIRVLNRKLKQKIRLHIQDVKDSANKPLGTKVQMEIPWIA